MTVIEEHYLDLEEATAADTGVYICRVSEQKQYHIPTPREIEKIIQCGSSKYEQKSFSLHHFWVSEQRQCDK